MSYFRIITFAFAIVLICGCSNNKTRLSGNPSEVLDTDTYNELQQKYKTIKNFQEGTAIVKIDKYGLIDCDGNEILACDYDTIYGVKKNFRIIVKDSLFGATNVEGHIIKQCSYADAQDGSCNYLAMKSNDKWGFIDVEGKDVTQYKYERIYTFNDSTFIAMYDGLYGVCDYQQNVLIPFKYDEILYKWGEEYPVTVVKSGEFYGLYNSKNQQVLECEYGLMLPNSSGYITIKKQAQNYKDVRKALVEAETGKIVIPFDYMDMGDFSDGLVSVENLEEKWGYLDKNGKTIIPFIYEEAGNFSEGLAAVYQFSGYMNTILGRVRTSKCGYINKEGQVVIPFQFKETIGIDVCEFHDGLAVQGISKNNRFALIFGYIDKKGNWVIKPQYDDAKSFDKGIAEVVINEQYGYINTKGEQIIPCKYDKYGGWFVNDSTIEMKKDGVEYYFNLQGKTVPKPE